jgi:hypothetical protein
MTEWFTTGAFGGTEKRMGNILKQATEKVNKKHIKTTY